MSTGSEEEKRVDRVDEANESVVRERERFEGTLEDLRGGLSSSVSDVSGSSSFSSSVSSFEALAMTGNERDRDRVETVVRVDKSELASLPALPWSSCKWERNLSRETLELPPRASDDAPGFLRVGDGKRFDQDCAFFTECTPAEARNGRKGVGASAFVL